MRISLSLKISSSILYICKILSSEDRCIFLAGLDLANQCIFSASMVRHLCMNCWQLRSHNFFRGAFPCIYHHEQLYLPLGITSRLPIRYIIVLRLPFNYLVPGAFETTCCLAVVPPQCLGNYPQECPSANNALNLRSLGTGILNGPNTSTLKATSVALSTGFKMFKANSILAITARPTEKIRF